MSAFRLQGTCMRCGAVENLRPDGTLVQHADARDYGSWRRRSNCGGAGAPPVGGSVAAWRASERAEATDILARLPESRAMADEVRAKELARLDRREAEANARLAAIEKAEKRLAKKGAADA